MPEPDGRRAAAETEQAPGGAVAPADAPLRLEDFLPYRLNVLASLVSQALSRIYVERYGLGVPEWRVLVTLGQFGAMTGKAVGAHSHMHKTKVSRAVAELEKRRLITRRANRADLRELFLSLTAAGRDHLRGACARRARLRSPARRGGRPGRPRRVRARHAATHRALGVEVGPVSPRALRGADGEYEWRIEL